MTTNNSVSPQKTQEQLAKEFGISVDTLQNYKMMADMIPELEELMDTGIVTKTTALAMMRNLSEDEQEEAREKLRNIDLFTLNRRKKISLMQGKNLEMVKVPFLQMEKRLIIKCTLIKNLQNFPK